MKVAVTIRCAKCDNIETVITESWQTLKTTCGCAGPYRVVERRILPEEETGPTEKTGSAEKPGTAEKKG
jgi:hypothetical protein